MKNIKNAFFLTCLLAWGAMPSVARAAGDIVLQGAMTQGGFMTTIVPEGSTVTLDGKPLPVGPDGRVVVGFERNFPATATLEIAAPNMLPVAHTVVVAPREYQTQHIKGVARRHVTPDPADLERIAADRAALAAARGHFMPIWLLEDGFTMPVKGRISGVYGSRRTFNGEERSWHSGTDIAAPTGTPVVAPAPGIVRLVWENGFYNGNTVVLDHGHNVTSVYVHLDTIEVEDGQTLNRGDRLGTVGATGRATGPHLHWGVSWGTTALDPLLFVNEEAK